jgi:hypothetical protein
MTNAEAIEKFKKIKRGNIYLIHQRCEGKVVIEDYSLCDMAISALEKQIPKKPIEKPNKYIEDLLYLYCPSCENWIGMWNKRVKYGDMYNNFNSHICPYCGQAIEFGGD